MERFDEMLKAMAEKEEMVMPNGFDGRLENVLDELPPRKKKRGLGAVKGVLVAAAACALLVGTAFAASPGLREMLAEVLGGFAPYAQEQDSEVYTWNGFEIKVLSAMADETNVLVYIQVRDLEGRGRLDLNTEAGRKEFPDMELRGIKSSKELEGFTGGYGVSSYDEATQTAVVEVHSEGILIDDLSGTEVWIDEVLAWLDEDPWDPPVKIPVDVEVMPSRTVLRNIETAETRVDEVRMSALSMTLAWEKVSDFFEGQDIFYQEITVMMKDGTAVKSKYNYSDGSGDYLNPDTGKVIQMLIWTFAEPVDVESVEGIYIGEAYFPVK